MAINYSRSIFFAYFYVILQEVLYQYFAIISVNIRIKF